MWLDRINPQLNIAWSGDWPPGQVEAARRIYDHELILFAAGECRVQLKDHEYRCKPGSYLIVPPDTVHISTALSTGTVRRFCFHFDWIYSPRAKPVPYCVFLPSRLQQSGIRLAPHWVNNRRWFGRMPRQLASLNLANRVCECWNSSDLTERATGRALLLELLVLLLSASSRRAIMLDRQENLAGRVKQLLDERIDARDSIQARMEQLGQSYAHLSRVFKKQYGISPVSYINAGRIERAKALLRKGKMSIKEVADKTGFNDPAYFSRLFRKTTGVSPAHFLSQAKANPLPRPIKLK